MTIDTPETFIASTLLARVATIKAEISALGTPYSSLVWVLPNIGDNPTTDHVRVWDLACNSRRISSAGRQKYDGIMQFSVFVGKGKGLPAATRIVDQIKKRFPLNESYSGVIIDDVTTGKKASEDLWLMLPVYVYYHFIN